MKITRSDRVGARPGRGRAEPTWTARAQAGIPARFASSASRRVAGSAVLIVFMMVAVIGVFLICNTRTLYLLKQELRLIEAKQLRKFAPPPVVRTNAPAVVPR